MVLGQGFLAGDGVRGERVVIEITFLHDDYYCKQLEGFDSGDKGRRGRRYQMFNWCSGYHVCLTHRRSQVRTLD
jgi:hypothetical protein